MPITVWITCMIFFVTYFPDIRCLMCDVPGTRPTATKRKGAKTTAVVDAPRRSNRLQRSDSVTGSAVDAAKANGGDSGVRRRRVTRTRKTLEQTDPNIILTSDGDIQGAEVQDSATTQVMKHRYILGSAIFLLTVPRLPSSCLSSSNPSRSSSLTMLLC